MAASRFIVSARTPQRASAPANGSPARPTRPGGGSPARPDVDTHSPAAGSDDRHDDLAVGFNRFGLHESLVTTLARSGITTAFPIQAATLPDSLAGRDVLGRGRTGSGKTLAFVLPILDRLTRSNETRKPNRPRALILAPTRELASQILAVVQPLATQLKMTSTVIFGGVGMAGQVSALRNGIDVLVACPGRLEDHVKQGHCKLGSVEITVLDEADHMSDLGFLPAVRRILDATPEHSQRMLFSATLDNAVDVIVRRYLHRPVTHSVDSEQSPVVEMAHHVLHVTNDDRLAVLTDLTSAPGRTIVFTRTKHRAKTLTRQLNMAGVPAVELHGNLAQNARERNLAAFSDGSAPTLVATDIAARGIHVDDVHLVIHADPPVEHKAYLHRSGRTARAGNSGTVITMMTDDQVKDVRDLTRKAGIAPTTTRVAPGHPLLTELAPGTRVLRQRREMPTEIPAGLPARGPRGGGAPGRPRPSGPGSNNGQSRRSGSGGGQGGSGRHGASSGNGSGHTAGRGGPGARTGAPARSGSGGGGRGPSTGQGAPSGRTPSGGRGPGGNAGGGARREAGRGRPGGR